MSKRKAGSDSLAETMIRQALQQSALGKAIGVTAQEDLHVEAPNTEGLMWVSETVDDVTVEEVLERYDMLQRNAAVKRALETGEAIDYGDRICFDAIPYVQGKVVPTLTQRRTYSVLGQNPLLEGLDDALVGLPVKFRGFVKVQLPKDFIHPDFAGKWAVFGVEIHEAVRPQAEEGKAEEDESKLDEVMRSIADELRQEKEWVLQRKAFRACMNQLASRVKEPISEALVDEALSSLWLENEGKTLLELNVSSDDREAALKSFLSTPALREDTRQSLAITAALDALGKRDNVVVDAEALKAQWAMNVAHEVSFEEAVQKARQGEKMALQLFRNLAYLHLADHVASLSMPADAAPGQTV